MYHERLRNYFKSIGLKQAEAADLLGYKKSMFSQYLSTKDINMEFISRLVTAFPDVDLNYIFKGEAKVYQEVNEPSEVYQSERVKIIEQIEELTARLKEDLSRK